MLRKLRGEYNITAAKSQYHFCAAKISRRAKRGISQKDVPLIRRASNRLRVFSKLLIYFRRDAIILTERSRRCREHEDFADMRLCRKIQGQFYRVSRILQKKQPRRRRFYALCVSRKNDRAPQSVVLRLGKRSSRSDIQKLRQRKNQGFQKNHKRKRR